MPLPVPDQKLEHFRVLVPSPLEVADMRDYGAEVMKAIAQAGNECGLNGKQLVSVLFLQREGQPSPDIVLQVKPKEPAVVTHLRWGLGFIAHPDQTTELFDKHAKELARSMTETLISEIGPNNIKGTSAYVQCILRVYPGVDNPNDIPKTTETIPW